MDLKVLVLFTAIAAILLKFILNYLKKQNSVKNIDGPTSIPLIGNIELAFLTNTNQLQWFFKNAKNFQKYFKMWLGTELWVVIYDPEMAEKVLTNPKLIKSNDYVFLKPWLGKGLLLNEGQKWFGRRKAITPAFHFNILEDFLEIFAQNTDVLMEKFDTDKPVNVPPLFLKCAFDVICETSMGLKMNSQNESNVPYVKAVNDITNIAYKRIMNPLTAIDWVFKLTKDHKIFEDSLKVVSETTQKVISERRKYYAERPDELQESTNELGVRKRMPLIDTLLKAHVDGQPLSNRDIEDEVNTFLFAGHDTTSHTLGYFFYNVAKHPEVQEKIFEEVSNVFGGIPENNELTTRKINELKYLEAVIKESMRLYATVPFIGRKLLEDTTIGNLNLPACTNINIFMYGIFKNEKLFKDPEKFVPDRFSHDNPESKKINPFAFIPFSAGPRNCIGQKFALLEMKTIILKSICNYTFSLADPNADLEVFQSIVLKAKNGVHLKFKKRV